MIKDFHFHDGETYPELRLHYRTLGKLKTSPDGKTNAILLLHSTGGSGEQFLNDHFAGVLFNPGQPFDVTQNFIIIPDAIGHGHSSRPSDGLRARFPHYNYDDMVEAQYRLVADRLKIGHLKMVIGMSMGCMHAWLWAEEHPEMMDGVMPLACLPVEIAGRNRMWRKVAWDAIVKDPAYDGGDYSAEPHGLGLAVDILQLISSSPVERQRTLPTGNSADAFIDKQEQFAAAHYDANDLAYQIDSSRGYDPAPKLDSIKAKVLAINFGDDLINPPELGILEREIKKVPRGRAVIVPASAQTHGHGTHTWPEFWKQYLESFLRELPQ